MLLAAETIYKNGFFYKLALFNIIIGLANKSMHFFPQIKSSAQKIIYSV